MGCRGRGVKAELRPESLDAYALFIRSFIFQAANRVSCSFNFYIYAYEYKEIWIKKRIVTGTELVRQIKNIEPQKNKKSEPGEPEAPGEGWGRRWSPRNLRCE